MNSVRYMHVITVMNRVRVTWNRWPCSLERLKLLLGHPGLQVRGGQAPPSHKGRQVWHHRPAFDNIQKIHIDTSSTAIVLPVYTFPETCIKCNTYVEQTGRGSGNRGASLAGRFQGERLTRSRGADRQINI